MAWEDKELAGVVFRNKFKRTDAQPAWKGTLLVNGEPHELAMWEKQGKNGQFFSFKIGPARELPAGRAVTTDGAGRVLSDRGGAPDEDDIGF